MRYRPIGLPLRYFPRRSESWASSSSTGCWSARIASTGAWDPLRTSLAVVVGASLDRPRPPRPRPPRRRRRRPVAPSPSDGWEVGAGRLSPICGLRAGGGTGGGSGLADSAGLPAASVFELFLDPALSLGRARDFVPDPDLALGSAFDSGSALALGPDFCLGSEEAPSDDVAARLRRVCCGEDSAGSVAPKPGSGLSGLSPLVGATSRRLRTAGGESAALVSVELLSLELFLLSFAVSFPVSFAVSFSVDSSTESFLLFLGASGRHGRFGSSYGATRPLMCSSGFAHVICRRERRHQFAGAHHPGRR